jgi:hypothetical protein
MSSQHALAAAPGSEAGSQTTEYALIMVVTVTRLRGYDGCPSFLRPARAGPCE